jgi:hypothetical protein
MNRKRCFRKHLTWFFFDAVSTVKINNEIKYDMLISNDDEALIIFFSVGAILNNM